MSYSIITLSGNLTRDPESIVKGDRTYVKISVAVNHTPDKTSFFGVLFSDERDVTRITTYAKKGSAITLIGDISVSNDDKRYVDVYGRSILELYTRNTTTGDAPTPKTTKPVDSKPNVAPPAKTGPADPVETPDDDDLPF